MIPSWSESGWKQGKSFNVNTNSISEINIERMFGEFRDSETNAYSLQTNTQGKFDRFI